MRATKLKLVLVAAVAMSGAIANAETPQIVHLAPAVDAGSSHAASQRVATSAIASPEGLHFASLSPAPAARAAATSPAADARSSGRSTKDLLALITIGGMLVAYQLFRKHRLLRQQPFSL